MPNRIILLKRLISIRIRSRDPGQHILEKQCLVGIGGEQFALSGYFAMAAGSRFLAAMVFFLWLWKLLLIVFRSFIPFGNFFT
jgi:hypothetical protein